MVRKHRNLILSMLFASFDIPGPWSGSRLPQGNGNIHLLTPTPRPSLFDGCFNLTKGMIMKISVILPIYNGEKYIEQTLNCIYGQSMSKTDIEVIMFFDKCTDNSLGITKNWMQNNPSVKNIKILVSNENVGPSVGRNMAVNQATGEYIHFCDIDDLINSGFYESLYHAANQANADVAVSCFVHERYPHDSVIFNQQYVITMPQDKINHTLVDIHGYSTRYIIRRSFWNANKFEYPPDMKYCEDMLVITKMLVLSNKIVVVPGAVYLYKRRSTSLLNARGKNKTRNFYWKIAKHDVARFLEQNNLQPTAHKYTRYRFKLFDVLPVITAKLSPDGMRIKFRLFGIIPICKISIRQKRYKI